MATTHSRRLRAPEGLLAGYGAAAVATLAGVALGGTGHPKLALAVLQLAVLVAATKMSLPVALVSAVVAWLFYDGFVIGRHGNLAWEGASGEWWLLVLVATAACGFALGWARHQG
jgi:hypothetical protein